MSATVISTSVESAPASTESDARRVRQAGYQESDEQQAGQLPPPPERIDDLGALIATAVVANPRLNQMQQEAAAAWERVRYADALPDPEVGAMALVPPMHFADGRQLASVRFSQRIPWLKRLSAREQQACFEAWALDASWQAERLQTVSAVKVAYYRLYVVEQQLRVNRENQKLIELLINVATERVVAQAATEGDVLLGTLELTRLEEQRYGLEERRASLQADLNRLLNRAAETPVEVPDELQPVKPDWTLDSLREVAWTYQPDIAAAQLRAQAASWGIRVAELERRPDVTLNLDWMVMAPREEPGMPAFGGDDTVQIGAMVSLPIWHEKYNAMRDEAVREEVARRFSLNDVQREYEATIAELLEQARAAARTAELYNSTMLPQARQTFEADQRAYVGPGTIDFDRVVDDFRAVLTLEEAYHRAIGDWAIAVARIEQAIARDVGALPLPLPPQSVPPAEPEVPAPDETRQPEENGIQLMAGEYAAPVVPAGSGFNLQQRLTEDDVRTVNNSNRFAARCGTSAVDAAAPAGR